MTLKILTAYQGYREVFVVCNVDSPFIDEVSDPFPNREQAEQFMQDFRGGGDGE